MVFARQLRDRIVRGEITCTVRIWLSARVRVGGRYPLGAGWVEVRSVKEIELSDISPELARRSGFAGVVDLIKTAKHGRGERVFLIDFEYRPV